MKKILLLVVSILLCAGCTFHAVNRTESMEAADLKILSPSGAPALSLLGLAKDSQENITVVEGTDILQASFVNPNPEYDIILAPTNLGVKLAQAGKTEYRLASVITWGNLYIVQNQASSEITKLAAFGQQAVPGLVFERVKDLIALGELTYYNAVTEAQAALLSGNADAALIAEPAATASILKAKETGKDFAVVYDIQLLWEHQTGSKGFPQAGIFVRETETNAEAVNQFLSIVEDSMNQYQSYAENNQSHLIAADIDLAGADFFGVPNSKIIETCYSKLGLNYRHAKECEKELTDFLSLFQINYDPSLSIR